MNIKEAREEIRNTVQAYTAKDPAGRYRIPAVRQRPLLLIGPPGIGKTAIMEQIADELHIGLVAYTITHHTRQSAIGLPVIRTKEYGGESYQVTEYTMSEIIASVYNCMEETGCKEGILFIDEINCVSETLAPAMLEFLQCKRFGSHKVPEGWVIAAAGNPQGFNNSVRDFDLVTLDRVRLLNVEENLNVFREFAMKAKVHPAILAFLEIKPQNFYRIEGHEEGTWFVTARGWEDLSGTLKVYEELKLPVNEVLVEEFLQFPMIAREFYSFYELYCRYGEKYPVGRLLTLVPYPGDNDAKTNLGENGTEPFVPLNDGSRLTYKELVYSIARAEREERISLIYLIYAECAGAFSDSSDGREPAKMLDQAAKLLLAVTKSANSEMLSPVEIATGRISKTDLHNLRPLRIFRNLVETNPGTARLPLHYTMPFYEKMMDFLDRAEEERNSLDAMARLLDFMMAGEI